MPLVSLLGRIAAFLSVALCCVLSNGADASPMDKLDSSCLRPGNFHAMDLNSLDPSNALGLGSWTTTIKSVQPPKRMLQPKRTSIALPLLSVKFAPVIKDAIQELSSCPQEACYVNDSNLEMNFGIRHWDAIVPVNHQSAPNLPLKNEGFQDAKQIEPFDLLNLAATGIETAAPMHSTAVRQMEIAFQRVLLHRHDRPLPLACQWQLENQVELAINRGASEAKRLAIAAQRRPDVYWEYYQDCDRWKVRFISRNQTQNRFRPARETINLVDDTDAVQPKAALASSESLLSILQTTPAIQNSIQWIGQTRSSANHRLSELWIGRIIAAVAGGLETQTADLPESPVSDKQSLQR